MIIDRLRLLAAILCIGGAFSSVLSPGRAAPGRPLTIVVPAPAGGTADVTIRTVAPKLSKILDQSVIVENRPGGGGTIASAFVAAAKPDGATLLMVYTSHATNPWILDGLPYDSATAFAPVAFLGKVPLLLAVPASSSSKTAEDLIALARSKPGTLTFGSSAIGGASHLGGELFSELTGGRILHIGYKGGAAAGLDLATGRISMLLDSQLALLPHVQAGRVRILGVASATQSVVFPQLEPIGKALPGFEATAWFGILAPTGTPSDEVLRLNKGFNEALQDEQVRAQLIDRGFEPQVMTPTEWGAFISSETARWGDLIKKVGLKKGQ